MCALEDTNQRHARYHCVTCHRPFDRKDTLSRHMQIHERRSQPKTRRKACSSCCQSKTRCDGLRPECGSCVRRGVTCIYGHNKEQTQTVSSPEDRQNPTVAITAPDSNGFPGNDQYRRGRGETHEFSPQYGDQQLMSNDSQDAMLPAAANGSDGRQWTALPSLPAQGMSPYDQTLLYSTFDDMDFNSNLDWFMDHTSVDVPFMGADAATLPLEPAQKASQIQPLPSGQAATFQDGQSDPGLRHLHTENLHQSSHDDSLGGIISPKPQLNVHSVGPWPSETPAPPQRHMSLPMLGSESQRRQRFSKFFAVSTITEKTRDALRRCLLIPLEHNPFQSLDLDHFPTNEQLDHCVDLYFAHFHQTVPVIHQPTFDPGKDLVVTLAVISIGSCYTDFINARSFAVCLSELTGRLLSYMAQHDRRFVRTPSYLIAQGLQGTHGYCSGSERLFELSESSRGTLVHNAKCMGLFRYETNEADLASLSPENAWRSWIDAEGLRRLGWAVYKYDGSVAYLHNSRPYLSVGDINLRLPASEEYWAAESAQAWAALHPWSQISPGRAPQLQSSIRTLFDGTPKPESKFFDEEHAIIVVLTLLRMLWSLKEIRSSPINDLVTPPVFDDGRRALLDAVQLMAMPLGILAKTHTGEELSRFVHRMLLVHTAHLYGAGDLMNWLYPYLRHGPEAENATRRMKQWAVEDARRIRDVAYHCAQILGILRHYPYNLPLEPFMLFHAGVVLSCVSSLLPTNTNTNQDPALQLDSLDRGESDIHERQMRWVITGTGVCPSLIGIPLLCCAAGGRAVLEQTAVLLKRRKVWGMARNLTKVVLSLQSRRDGLGTPHACPPAGFNSSDAHTDEV